MIDFEKIGTRIAEERKFGLHVSQRKMAEDLFMYQADISNLEKAKPGSGITDLYKLDLIANYLNIPTEKLIFGKNDDSMLKYYGKKMQLIKKEGGISAEHKDILLKLMSNEDYLKGSEKSFFVCGPYTVYSFVESLTAYGKDETEMLMRLHTFLFYKDQIAGVMVADLTTVMQHIYQPSFQNLRTLIPFDVLDVTDALRTINPYWALWIYSTGDEKEEYMHKMLMRMDQLRDAGEGRPIVYIESVYVRTDYRKHGLFRMYIDYLKHLFDGAIFWLNLEPTSGAEMNNEYRPLTSYSVTEVGQMNLNAMIAEKVGFTIDPDIWHKDAETIDENGNVIIKPVEVRKCAYFLPEEIKRIIANDGDLVALGRAKQKLAHSSVDENRLDDENLQENSIDLGSDIVDFSSGEVDGYTLSMVRIKPDFGKYKGRRIFIYAAHSDNEKDKYKFGVTSKNPIDYGIDHEGQDEQYDWLDDATESEMFKQLCLVNTFRETFREPLEENDKI